MPKVTISFDLEGENSYWETKDLKMHMMAKDMQLCIFNFEQYLGHYLAKEGLKKSEEKIVEAIRDEWFEIKRSYNITEEIE